MPPPGPHQQPPLAEPISAMAYKTPFRLSFSPRPLVALVSLVSLLLPLAGGAPGHAPPASRQGPQSPSWGPHPLASPQSCAAPQPPGHHRTAPRTARTFGRGCPPPQSSSPPARCSSSPSPPASASGSGDILTAPAYTFSPLRYIRPFKYIPRSPGLPGLLGYRSNSRALPSLHPRCLLYRVFNLGSPWGQPLNHLPGEGPRHIGEGNSAHLGPGHILGRLSQNVRRAGGGVVAMGYPQETPRPLHRFDQGITVKGLQRHGVKVLN